MSDNSKSLISSNLNRDMVRKQDGLLLYIILDESEDSKNHPESKSMLWMVDIPLSRKCFLITCTLYLLTPCRNVLKSVPAHMVAFVHVIYCCFLLICKPVTTLLPYVIIIIDGRSDRSKSNMSRCFHDSKKFWVLVSMKYFLKIMHYMESASTGNSVISVNLVMINVVIFA